MITFKRFLEAHVGVEPTYTEVAVEEAIAALNAHCKDAAWMLEYDTPLYRGFKDFNGASLEKTGFLSVDSSTTERKSENTSNYYTVILDNIPSMKDFPKRSRSFIGSNTESGAGSYSRGGGAVARMIPYDDVKIGVVGRQDMWDTTIDAFGQHQKIWHFNDQWRHISSLDDGTWDSFVRFGKKVDDHNLDALDKLSKAFGSRILQHVGMTPFLRMLDDGYGPKQTGFKWATTKEYELRPLTDYAKVGKTEVWVSGKVMLISEGMWYAMRKSL